MSRGEKKVFIVVLGVSLLATLANAAFFFYGLLHTPKDMVFLGVVHYFEDYFFYVSHFTQGAQGAWMVANRYTSEVTSPSFVYWTNLMMGKIAGLAGLSPIWSYNLWVMVMVFSALIASYFVIRLLLPKQPMAQITAFLFSLTATSPMAIEHGRFAWNPIHEQESPHFAFDRLGEAPHHALQTFLFYLLTLLFFYSPKTKFARIVITLLEPLSIMLLVIDNPVTATLWILAAWAYAILAVCIRRFHFLKRFTTPTIPWGRLIILTISFLIAFLYVNATLNTLPRLQAKLWEAAQSSHPTIINYLVSGGPLFSLAAIGIVLFFISPQPLFLFAILAVLGAHVAYFSPIPHLFGIINGRFIAPSLYPFLAILAVYPILLTARFLTKKKHGLHPQTILLLCIALFLIFNAPTLAWEMDRRVGARVTTDPFYYLNYLPKDTYDGMLFLSRQLPFDDVVLGSYISRTDLLIPALTGHSGYSGHMLETINDSEKNAQNVAFFNLNMTPAAAKTWMKNNRIRYVVATSRDINHTILEIHYPFLTPIYHAENIYIYHAK